MIQTSMTEGRIIALVPAAGVGARALRPDEPARPKQYRVLNGQAVLRRTVLALLADPRIATVRVVVAADDPLAADVLAGLPRTECLRCGGVTRADTVEQGLLQGDWREGDWALVHDAARPGLPPDALARLIDACLEAGRGGLLALPVADTVKRETPPEGGVLTAPAAPSVAATLPREGLWLAQTPQLFPATQLLLALQQARLSGLLVTDEASAVEALQVQPLLVPGAMANMKLTWPADFEWMEKWIS